MYCKCFIGSHPFLKQTEQVSRGQSVCLRSPSQIRCCRDPICHLFLSETVTSGSTSFWFPKLKTISFSCKRRSGTCSIMRTNKCSFSLVRQSRLSAWHGTVRLPGVQGSYVPSHRPPLQSCEGSVWPPDIKGRGGFRGWGRLSIHGHIKQDSLSVGTPLEACQTFPYTAQSVHTLTHTLTVHLNTQRSPSLSASPPLVCFSHTLISYILQAQRAHIHAPPPHPVLAESGTSLQARITSTSPDW